MYRTMMMETKWEASRARKFLDASTWTCLAKNQGYSRGLGNVSAAANRQARKKTGGKSRGAREKHETSSEKKNRKSVGKRNYRLMRRSFHHVASERASAIDRCFTTKVIRVFVRPLFFLFSSKRLPVTSIRATFFETQLSPWYIGAGILYRIAPKHQLQILR